MREECIGACKALEDPRDLSITVGGRLAPCGSVYHVVGGRVRLKKTL